MKIMLGADHRGFEAIARLRDRLISAGHEATIVEGCADGPCDYPVPAFRVASRVATGEVDRGILVCGTGIGVSIAANKVKGARAALVSDELTAELSRTHNNANIMCLSGDLLGYRLIEKLTDVFINTEFEGGRHARRLQRIEAIERGDDPATAQVDA